MKTFVLILMGVLMAGTLGAMFAGVFGLGRTGPGAERRSNLLMRWRVLFQFAALVMVLLLALVLRS